jgi:hypothetical protein
MNWKIVLGLAAVIVIVVLAGWSGWAMIKPLVWPTAAHSQKLQQVTITTQTDKQLTLQVEVVADAASITRGLSGRTELGSDGMLFVFSFPGKYPFWMKEMSFPIDIVWIYQKEVIGIAESVPFPSPGTDSNQLPRYSPPDLVDMVLELPAGFSRAQGIEVGSRVVVSSDEPE